MNGLKVLAIILKKEIEFKKYSYVCNLHFEQDCFSYGTLGKVLRLKAGSYPTIFHNYATMGYVY